MNGADIWHTVNALRALAAAGRWNRAAEAFVHAQVTANGELSYWSSHPSLCIETCAAAFQALPSLRTRLRRAVERHALPGGRWPNFILPGRGGYDSYLTGPSVTGWALAVLARSHPLAVRGRAYLADTLTPGGLWRAQGGFYATPFYPAHVALPHVDDPRPVLNATLHGQDGSGGWAFDPEQGGPPSALPTALALVTLLAEPSPGSRVRRAARSAVAWLLAGQKASGAFSAAPAPTVLFYAGDVYATSVAVMALMRAEEALA